MAIQVVLLSLRMAVAAPWFFWHILTYNNNQLERNYRSNRELKEFEEKKKGQELSSKLIYFNCCFH